jgi:hypothetical protein
VYAWLRGRDATSIVGALLVILGGFASVMFDRSSLHGWVLALSVLAALSTMRAIHPSVSISVASGAGRMLIASFSSRIRRSVASASAATPGCSAARRCARIVGSATR